MSARAAYREASTDPTQPAHDHTAGAGAANPYRVTRRNYGQGHGYTDDLGRKVPGVTTILKAYPKPALTGWAARMVADLTIDEWDKIAEMRPSTRHAYLAGAPNRHRNDAGTRGTRVHVLADRIRKGEDPRVPDAVRGHVDAFLRWMDEWDAEIVASEFIVGGDGYAGTGDIFAWCRDPEKNGRNYELWIIDAKTSNGVYGDTRLQLAPYGFGRYYAHPGGVDPKKPKGPRLPDVEFERPDWTRAGVLHLRAEGYDLVPMTVGDEEYQTFRHLREVYEFWQHDRDGVGDVLFAPPPLDDDAPCRCGQAGVPGFHREDADCELYEVTTGAAA